MSTYQHADGTECLWDAHDQAWYPMHPLYPMSRPCHQSHEPRREGLAPFCCGNPACPAHTRSTTPASDGGGDDA